ncbi:hypothetical protein ACFVX3_33185, partial [Rhodococcus erythropolis]
MAAGKFGGMPTALLQPRIQELLAITAADVIASFPTAQLAALTRSAEQLLPQLIAYDLLSGSVGVEDHSGVNTTPYARPLARGGNAAYLLLDILRQLFKGGNGVDTAPLAQCASLAVERRHLRMDPALHLWTSPESNAVRVRRAAQRALLDHPLLENLLMTLLDQCTDLLERTATNYTMTLVRLYLLGS